MSADFLPGAGGPNRAAGPGREDVSSGVVERVATAYLPFEGEQHGFRKAENIKRALDAELYFYSRVFGFVAAGPIEPVDIENF